VAHTGIEAIMSHPENVFNIAIVYTNTYGKGLGTQMVEENITVDDATYVYGIANVIRMALGGSPTIIFEVRDAKDLDEVKAILEPALDMLKAWMNTNDGGEASVPVSQSVNNSVAGELRTAYSEQNETSNIELLKAETSRAVILDLVEQLRGTILAKEAKDIIIRRLENEDPLVGVRMAEALGELGIRDEKVILALNKALGNRNTIVQAYRALVKLSVDRMIVSTTLAELSASSEDLVVRYRSVNLLSEYLNEVALKQHQEFAGEKIVSMLLNSAYGEKSMIVKNAKIKALGTIPVEETYLVNRILLELKAYLFGKEEGDKYQTALKPVKFTKIVMNAMIGRFTKIAKMGDAKSITILTELDPCLKSWMKRETYQPLQQTAKAMLKSLNRTRDGLIHTFTTDYLFNSQPSIMGLGQLNIEQAMAELPAAHIAEVVKMKTDMDTAVEREFTNDGGEFSLKEEGRRAKDENSKSYELRAKSYRDGGELLQMIDVNNPVVQVVGVAVLAVAAKLLWPTISKMLHDRAALNKFKEADINMLDAGLLAEVRNILSRKSPGDALDYVVDLAIYREEGRKTWKLLRDEKALRMNMSMINGDAYKVVLTAIALEGEEEDVKRQESLGEEFSREVERVREEKEALRNIDLRNVSGKITDNRKQGINAIDEAIKKLGKEAQESLKEIEVVFKRNYILIPVLTGHTSTTINGVTTQIPIYTNIPQEIAPTIYLKTRSYYSNLSSKNPAFILMTPSKRKELMGMEQMEKWSLANDGGDSFGNGLSEEHRKAHEAIDAGFKGMAEGKQAADISTHAKVIKAKEQIGEDMRVELKVGLLNLGIARVYEEGLKELQVWHIPQGRAPPVHVGLHRKSAYLFIEDIKEISQSELTYLILQSGLEYLVRNAMSKQDISYTIERQKEIEEFVQSVAMPFKYIFGMEEAYEE
ncbi:MAG: hypothetical protein PHE58_07820, partial [Candidatus Omnitrophica bacterium]|nr:hypothetical protein [Candidatus Omnitrophota bacterium]